MKTLHTAILTILALFLYTPLAQADTLDDIQFFVDAYYYGDMPENLFTMTSVNEIIHSLDEYSRYLTAEEYQTYLATVAANKQPANVASTTAPQTQSAITSSILYDNIGYLKIATFPTNLGQKVHEHWLALKKAGATELIIDLRYNGGGYVDSAEQLLGFFSGVTDAYKLATREGTRMIKPIATDIKFPQQTYVLVNRYSASASEIVVAALKDQQAATIVGETTKGKGTIQSIFQLADGGALKLTIGEFTGPKGTKVHKKGITPTIQTEPNKELITIYEQIRELGTIRVTGTTTPEKVRTTAKHTLY
ncbi:S41 family peptidase [Sporosarcina sp. YIM B06819]|uniref:S41 family peptidase n=1 Tax=Sporosarcina sp. YIM B06819 TaxID=3081769 RepID=UPI00298C777B|nr:S41 family peptidase [Sporosarcina sp. YIM B06819]